LRVFQRWILWIALIVQVALLGWRLDLLPRWDDELYTLRLVTRPARDIVRVSQEGVHPPIYFLLAHGWLKLPLPGSTLTRVRALSVVLAVTATAVFYRLWLTEPALPWRAFFLGLWVFSPFLVLYARMARSYTLQLLLVIVTLHFACRWLRRPGDRMAAAGYVLSALLLLYVHYLPGLAVAGAVTMVGLWRRRWSLLLPSAVIALLYLPWLAAFTRAVGLVAGSKPYFAASSVAAEILLRLAYGFVGFNFGETIPVWRLGVGLALTPWILWALWRASRSAGQTAALLVLVGTFGFWIAFSRVSFPFVGARLLFLLPFYYGALVRGLEGAGRRGLVAGAGMLAMAAGGLHSYYAKRDFLNKGYVVDFREIAEVVERNSGEGHALVILDPYTESSGYYLHGPSFPYPMVVVRDLEAADRALAAVREKHPPLVWFLRSGRDSASEEVYRRLERRLLQGYSLRRHYFVPYSWLDRLAMDRLGWRNCPTHVVEAWELRRRSAPSAGRPSPS
jgi:hypothetical protein